MRTMSFFRFGHLAAKASLDPEEVKKLEDELDRQLEKKKSDKTPEAASTKCEGRDTEAEETQTKVPDQDVSKNDEQKLEDKSGRGHDLETQEKKSEGKETKATDHDTEDKINNEQETQDKKSEEKPEGQESKVTDQDATQDKKAKRKLKTKAAKGMVMKPNACPWNLRAARSQRPRSMGKALVEMRKMQGRHGTNMIMCTWVNQDSMIDMTGITSMRMVMTNHGVRMRNGMRKSIIFNPWGSHGATVPMHWSTC